MAQTPGAGRPDTGRTSTQSDFRLAVADSSVVMLGIAVLGLSFVRHEPLLFPLFSCISFAAFTGSGVRVLLPILVLRTKLNPSRICASKEALGRTGSGSGVLIRQIATVENT